MPNFLDAIFNQLRHADGRVVLREIRGNEFVSVTGRELLDQVQGVRSALRGYGLQPGDRCALLAPNSIRWTVVDLALMAEGVIVVPLYSRQAPADLAGMMKDCQPRLLLANDDEMGDAMGQTWPPAPPCIRLDELFKQAESQERTLDKPKPRGDAERVTIIYTSGTSGESKGVCLNVANITHMLGCTRERLDQLMGSCKEPDRVFHYLPFNFAGSRIVLLTCLSRDSVLTLSTDLTCLADEIQLASQNYFLNVPTLLERVKRGVEEAVSGRSAFVRTLYAKACDGWRRQRAGRGRPLDEMWLALGEWVIFSKIRKRFGTHLRALICGSAPLAPETQEFFMMLGIPVLQVYGLTETTAICTMDDPRAAIEPGYVGPAITGIEMKLGENAEILVRGPHIFPGYWNRPEETARVLQNGWYHTGDQGEVNARGNWRISGRLKNLIILNSGHNIAPEPMEEKIAQRIPGAQAVLVGNGRGYLCAVISGAVERATVQPILDNLNAELPHYRQIRNFLIMSESFSTENGLLTVNGKVRRDAINARFATEINAMYDGKSEMVGSR